MKIHFKKLVPEAQKPKFGKPGDAGADLVATSVDFSREHQVVYGTGLAVEIPEGMVGLIFPRSSIRDKEITLSNSVGVIDSGYRGEIMVTFNIRMDNIIAQEIGEAESLEELSEQLYDLPYDVYNIGDRIAQLVIMPVPLAYYVEVDELSETERGKEGHGSTGN
jgi:dUTP pyrophosphatase